jgi:chromosome segregation ATPase
LKHIKKWKATMEKNQLRRGEALAHVETLMKQTDQRRAELSKELSEVENHRNDLKETIDILSHQAQGLQQVLDRANNPKVKEDTIDAGVEYSGRAVANRATAGAANWYKGV